jgi:glycerol transport system ATP-binding protein
MPVKKRDKSGRLRVRDQFARGGIAPSRRRGGLMLELKGVGRQVNGEMHLSDISLALPRGSFNILLGPTLAGKTSLLRTMAGLDPSTSGAISLDGVDITRAPLRKRSVAMVYQQFINYPALSVRENIAMPLRAKKALAAEIEQKVSRAAELLRLGPYLQRKPHELSGGQQQRVALARAIVKQADFVALDEPLANLDYKLREELRAELPKFFAGSSSIVVFATTDPVEALLLGGNVATMAEGRITQFGKGLDVYRRPRDLVTARTFSDPPLNLLPVTANAGRTVPADASAPQCTLPRLPDGAWTLGFRPHHLRIGAGSGASFRLKVISTEVTGSESFVHLAFGAARFVLLTHGVHIHPAGAELEAHVALQDVMVFDSAGNTVALAEAA